MTWLGAFTVWLIIVTLVIAIFRNQKRAEKNESFHPFSSNGRRSTHRRHRSKNRS